MNREGAHPVRLTPRLAAAARCVRPGSVFIDVGTDHGLLAAFLVESGRCPRGYACDINPGPLDKARQTLGRLGLEDRVSLRLTDGLAGFEDAPARDIVIAGMGGELIAAILDRAPFVRDPAYRLTLQPMTRARELRRYLGEAGFAVLREQAVREGERLYSVLEAAWTGRRETDPLLWLTGGLPRENSREARELLQRQLVRLSRQLEGRCRGRDAFDAAGLKRDIAFLSGVLAGMNERERGMNLGHCADNL